NQQPFIGKTVIVAGNTGNKLHQPGIIFRTKTRSDIPPPSCHSENFGIGRAKCNVASAPYRFAGYAVNPFGHTAGIVDTETGCI
ncbi:TPA: hypothetical protein ACFIY7_000871, partial [Neisseria gonorrhoeae]